MLVDVVCRLLMLLLLAVDADDEVEHVDAVLSFCVSIVLDGDGAPERDTIGGGDEGLRGA